MNAAAYEAIGSPAAVELLYDVDAEVLGVRPVDPKLVHAVYVRASTKSPAGPFVISALAFLNHYGIDTTEARRWSAEVVDEFLSVDLTAPNVVVSARTKSRDKPARRPRNAASTAASGSAPTEPDSAPTAAPGSAPTEPPQTTEPAPPNGSSEPGRRVRPRPRPKRPRPPSAR